MDDAPTVRVRSRRAGMFADRYDLFRTSDGKLEADSFGSVEQAETWAKEQGWAIEPPCPWTDADECSMAAERSVAATDKPIPGCTDHNRKEAR